MPKASAPLGKEPLLDALRQTLPDAAPSPKLTSLVVAFSGGIDSSALLHALASLRGDFDFSLRAIHINHQLHADASSWAARCQSMCDALAVPLTIVPVAVDTGSPLGIEAAARTARYAALVECSDDHDYLVLAQHRDDQAETVLLRLLRGSGCQGLSAMRAFSRRDGRHLWRPWLALSRAVITDYAQRHQIEGIDDPANNDPRFVRSVLRHQVLPLLRQHWPGADLALVRSAAILGDEAARLAARDGEQLAHAQGVDPDSLSVVALNALDPCERHGVLRAWIAERGLPPIPARVIDRVQSEVLDAAESASPELCWANACLRRYRELLYLATADPHGPPVDDRDPPSPRSTSWDGRLPMTWADRWQLAFDPAPVDALPLRVAARLGGERLRQTNARQHQTLQHLLQSLGIPPWQRSSTPLLWIDARWLERSTGYPAGTADEHLLAVGDLLRSEPLVLLEQSLGARFLCGIKRGNRTLESSHPD